MNILTLDQRSDEWRQARCGRLCASRAADMLATIKSGEAAARRDLRLQIVVERLTHLPQDEGFVSKDMERGTALEPDARAAYESLTGNLVQETGFIAHDSLAMGCSPDGYIGDWDGLLECKVPKSATHVGYIRSRKVPSAYLAQITAQLFVTGAAWCDFFSFDPRLPPALQAFLVRVNRSDVDLKAFELAAVLFLSECDREYAELEQLAAVAV